MAAGSVMAQFVTLDPTFDPGLGPTGGNGGTVLCMLENAGGDIIVGGNFTSFDGTGSLQCALLDDDGTLLTSWDGHLYYSSPSTTYSTVQSMCLNSAGDLVLGGLFDTYAITNTGTSAQSAPCLAKLDPSDGSWVGFANIGTGFSASSGGLSVNEVVASGTDLLVGGAFTSYDGDPVKNLVRIDNSGTLDGSFSANCSTYFASGMVNTVKQFGSMIYVGGDFVYSSGGQTWHNILALNTNGQLITTFDPPDGINSSVHWIEEGPSGTIYIGGAFTNCDVATSQTGVARLNATTGVRDTGFSNPGLYIYCAGVGIKEGVVDAVGRVYVTGCVSVGGGASNTGMVRLLDDGSVDQSYLSDGAGFTGGASYTMMPGPTGFMYYAGSFDAYDGTPDAIEGVARLEDHGTECVDLVIHFAGTATTTEWDITGPTPVSGAGVSGNAGQEVTFTYCLLPGDYEIEVTDGTNNPVGWYLARTGQPTVRYIDNEDGWNPVSGVSSPSEEVASSVPDFQIPMSTTTITSAAGVLPDVSTGMLWNLPGGGPDCPGGTGTVTITTNVNDVQLDYFDPDGHVMQQSGACTDPYTSTHRTHAITGGTATPSGYNSGRIARGVWLNVRARGWTGGTGGSPTGTFGPVDYVCFNDENNWCTTTPSAQGEEHRGTIIPIRDEGLFPNPSMDGRATLVLGASAAVGSTPLITVRDAMGREVPCSIEQRIGADGSVRAGLDMGHVAPGIYMVCTQRGTEAQVLRWMIQ